MKIKSDEPPQYRVASQITRSLKIISRLVRVLGEYCSKHFKQIKQLIRGEKKLVMNFGLLFVLAIIPWVSETSYNQGFYSGLNNTLEPLDPIRTGQFAETISEYTPGVAVESDEIALTLMAKSDNYSLDQQLAVNVGKDIKGPDRQDATYTIQSGETITQIAEKFNLHVASILDANSISAENLKKVKEGTTLIIPSTDTSTSNDWLIAVNQAEEKEKAALAAAQAEALKKKQLASSKNRALAAGTGSSSGYGGIATGSIITPVSGGGKGISQYFGRGHSGVDYMGNAGTPILAAQSGKVILVSSGWNGGYGNQIVIDHGGGRATRYAHLSSFAVSAGQIVSQGQKIGGMGNSGRVYGRTGIHLHFELIINGRPVNPL